MTFTPTALVLAGLLLAAWVLVAAWFMLGARAREKRAETALRNARRLARMVEESPAIPLLVRADGRIEASPRLARWLGLERVPQYLSELKEDDGGGIPVMQLGELNEQVRRCQ